MLCVYMSFHWLVSRSNRLCGQVCLEYTVHTANSRVGVLVYLTTFELIILLLFIRYNTNCVISNSFIGNKYLYYLMPFSVFFSLQWQNRFRINQSTYFAQFSLIIFATRRWKDTLCNSNYDILALNEIIRSRWKF